MAIIVNKLGILGLIAYLAFSLSSCSTNKLSSATTPDDYLIHIKKIKYGQKPIDLEEEFWLLKKNSNSEPIESIQIGESHFVPYYIAFDLPQSVKICCMDESFEGNDSLRQKQYDIIAVDDIIKSKAKNVTYSDYQFRIYTINSGGFCLCGKKFSGLTSEYITNFSYPTSKVQAFPASGKKRAIVKQNLNKLIGHSEIFGRED